MAIPSPPLELFQLFNHPILFEINQYRMFLAVLIHLIGKILNSNIFLTLAQREILSYLISERVKVGKPHTDIGLHLNIGNEHAFSAKAFALRGKRERKRVIDTGRVFLTAVPLKDSGALFLAVCAQPVIATRANRMVNCFFITFII